MQSRIRTFVAVETGPDIRGRAAQLIGKLRAAAGDVKWVDPQILHWTLSFLGDVDRNDIPGVCFAVQRAVVGLPSFDLEARGVGAFPNVDHPRTIWLGVGQGEAEMIELQKRVEQALAPLGFRPEARRFRPHLTLGRARGESRSSSDLAQLLTQHAAHPGGVMSVDEVIVFSSTLERSGPIHDPLATAALEG